MTKLTISARVACFSNPVTNELALLHFVPARRDETCFFVFLFYKMKLLLSVSSMADIL